MVGLSITITNHPTGTVSGHYVHTALWELVKRMVFSLTVYNRDISFLAQQLLALIAALSLLYFVLLITVGAIFFENQNACLKSPRMHQSSKSLWPSSRGGPEVSKTPPTCKVWMILSQVMTIK